jgi:hypothetical protein
MPRLLTPKTLGRIFDCVIVKLPDRFQAVGWVDSLSGCHVCGVLGQPLMTAVSCAAVDEAMVGSCTRAEVIRRLPDAVVGFDHVGIAAREQFEIELTSRIEKKWVMCFRMIEDETWG